MTYGMMVRPVKWRCVRQYDVTIFKTLRLRNSWAGIDETCHVYSMDVGSKLLGSGILNFGPCAARGRPELSPVAFSDSLYRTLQLLTHSQQRRYAGFYVGKIPTKNLPLGNFRHQIEESSPVRRDAQPQAGCLSNELFPHLFNAAMCCLLMITPLTQNVSVSQYTAVNAPQLHSFSDTTLPRLRLRS